MTDRSLVERLGFWQKTYKRDVPPEALYDLAVYCGVWDDMTVSGISNERLREMYGRRQAFFRIWRFLKLTPAALEAAHLDQLERRANLRRNGE